jgi:hypothetical protein
MSKKVFKKVLPYVIKAMMLTGGVAAMTSCEKPENNEPQHDSTLYSNGAPFTNMEPAYSPEKFAATADSGSVRFIYIVPRGTFYERSANGWTTVVNKLEIGKTYAPNKFKANGKFEGATNISDADSVRLVLLGFEVSR